MPEQVPNDNLGLRQPVHITSLTYLGTNHPNQFIAGTRLGHVRHYDTRSARRPVSDWKLTKMESIKTLEKGASEQCVTTTLYFFPSNLISGSVKLLPAIIDAIYLLSICELAV